MLRTAVGRLSRSTDRGAALAATPRALVGHQLPSADVRSGDGPCSAVMTQNHVRIGRLARSAGSYETNFRANS